MQQSNLQNNSDGHPNGKSWWYRSMPTDHEALKWLEDQKWSTERTIGSGADPRNKKLK